MDFFSLSILFIFLVKRNVDAAHCFYSVEKQAIARGLLNSVFLADCDARRIEITSPSCSGVNLYFDSDKNIEILALLKTFTIRKACHPSLCNWVYSMS